LGWSSFKDFLVKGNSFKKGLILAGLLLAGLSLTACGQATPPTPTASSEGLAAPSGRITPAKTIAPGGTPTPARGGERVVIGSPAPDFSLTSLDNQTVKLSQFRGTPVLINFWATWCPPCKEELPLLVKTHQANQDRLVILGVDMAEEAGVVRDKVREVGITYPVLLDSQNEVTNRYQVRGYPTSLFVDKNGIVQRITVGQLTEDTIKSALDRVYSIN
jgi:thiol-disulfide isomerase/thioredoxin